MSDHGTFRVQLFAGAAELAGVRVVELQLVGTATVEALQRELCERFPQLRSLVSISRWAVDRRFATAETVVQPGQEIALIPPVSGG